MRYNAVLDVLFTDDEPVVEPATCSKVSTQAAHPSMLLS